MKIFRYFYDKTLIWSRHQKAPTFLTGMSFAESVFFPIPVDIMLAPMALSKPTQAWHYAMLATIASVIGGIFGYYLGYFAYESLLQPWIESVGYQPKLDQAISWFEQYGVWVVFVAGFSPIPYKVFTISAGIMQMAIVPFIVASLIGRGMRFYLVAGLMRWGGSKMEEKLRDIIDFLGWAVVIIVAVLYFMLR